MTTHLSLVATASRGLEFLEHNTTIAVRAGMTRINLLTRHTLACLECYLHLTPKKNTEPATNSIICLPVHVIDRRGANLGKDYIKPEETKSMLGKVLAANVLTTEERLSRTERWAKEATVPGSYDTPTVDAANA